LIEVAGVAANGRIGLNMLTQVNPDAVVMDIEMPEMSGLEALPLLRKSHPRLPVIMFSTLCERGASGTLAALAAGASDYVTKPREMADLQAAMTQVREQLTSRIKAFCHRPTTGTIPVNRTVRSVARRMESKIEVVAIGASTGGPNALTDVLTALPLQLPVPIVITQHMPATFTRLLADGLTTKTGHPVHEGVAGMPLESGHVYIAPGGFHMTVSRSAGGGVVGLNQNPLENCCRPAVDVLFRSIAEGYKDRALAVVLTGMGKDGLRGAESIREVGGTIYAQDEATSVVWGMPGFVANAGLADRVLPLSQIADGICDRIAVGRVPLTDRPRKWVTRV
jgi:two-component system, chemotaxis family, protein-glutamate methylesterase/glutaminase